MTKHPETGLHYIFVIPQDPGAYVDYAVGYATLAEKIPWISTISHAAFRNGGYEQHRRDPSIMFVCFTMETPAAGHDCLIAALYMEAIGEPSKMLDLHVQHWKDFGARAPTYDAVLVHTPAMIAPLERGMSLPTYLFPAGYSPAWGAPHWNAHKRDHLLYWGSTVGRRVELIPWLKARSPEVRDASGCFGRAILAEIEHARAALYIAHSDVQSFSTWRLWQMLATSTALIAETGDTWPFVACEHYLPIPAMGETEESRLEVHKLIVNYWRDIALLDRTARRAHDHLAEAFSLERCVSNYLVFASKDLLEKRK